MQMKALLTAACLALTSLLTANAQIPQIVGFNGWLKIGDNEKFTGVAKLKFALVSQDGAASLWSNDGTSQSGSEPVQSLAVQINSGNFSVLLGDPNLPQMSPLSPAAFAGADVRVRIWVDKGDGAFVQMAPDQRVPSVGFAFVAGQVASGAVGTAAVAPAAITTEKLKDEAVTTSKLAPDVLTLIGGRQNSQLSAPDGDPANAVSVDNDGNVSVLKALRSGGLTSGAATDAGGYLILSNPLKQGDAAHMWALWNMTSNHTDSLQFWSYEADGDPCCAPRFIIRDDGTTVLAPWGGNVGVGANFPSAKLHVVGDVLVDGGINISGTQPLRVGHGHLGFASYPGVDGTYLELRGTNYGQYIDFSNDLAADYDARLILESDDLLAVQGATLQVPAIKIVGGADIAERFHSNDEDIRPGMVVRYAADGSQKVELCSKGCDPLVAGVVSEAGGVNSGLVLEQVGTRASGNHTVAILGRVKVWADATDGPIGVGDILVSSEKRGFAKRSADPSSATGAIIGKATSNLPSGTGLIWMHVMLR